MQKEAEVGVIESEGTSSKPTGYVQITYLILFLTNIRAFKALEDEGVTVAPPRHQAPKAPSSSMSITDSPAPALSLSEAVPVPVPASVSVSVSAAVLEPTPASASIPTELATEDIHPQGSSRATGRIICGRAASSYYSPADEEKAMSDSIGTAKLTAKIYTSNLDPLNLNHNNMVPSSKVTIKMNPNLGPILDNISQRYPAIQGIYLF